jgi:hypothetical protein
MGLSQTIYGSVGLATTTGLSRCLFSIKKKRKFWFLRTLRFCSWTAEILKLERFCIAAKKFLDAYIAPIYTVLSESKQTCKMPTFNLVYK